VSLAHPPVACRVFFPAVRASCRVSRDPLIALRQRRSLPANVVGANGNRRPSRVGRHVAGDSHASRSPFRPASSGRRGRGVSCSNRVEHGEPVRVRGSSTPRHRRATLTFARRCLSPSEGASFVLRNIPRDRGDCWRAPTSLLGRLFEGGPEFDEELAAIAPVGCMIRLHLGYGHRAAEVVGACFFPSGGRPIPIGARPTRLMSDHRRGVGAGAYDTGAKTGFTARGQNCVG